MKMKFAYILLLAAFISSCSKKNDRAFSETPEERVNKVLNQYQTQLEGGVNGWKGLLYGGDGKPFYFFFKFDNKNRVITYSDFKSEFAGTGKESSYRLKALQQVSLLFDTYTYLHVLADPDPSVAGGATGSGFNVDFEFYFDNASNDTINLVGRKHANSLQLIRATKAEADAFAAGSMKNAMVLNDNYGQILQYWKTFTLGTTTYQVTLDTADRTITMFYKSGNAVRRSTSGYYYNANGIVFQTPITAVGTTITGFNNISWNAANKTFSMRVNNTTVTLGGVNSPAAIEAGIAHTWRYTAGVDGNYWFNYQGIRINGVNNAYRTDTLTFNDSTGKYTNYYLLYQPGVLSATIDAFGPVFLNQAQTGLYLKYGTYPEIEYLADERMVLKENGTLEDYDYPATGAADLMRKWLYNPSGVYLVRLTDQTYDMVSASDPTSWMKWYLR